MLQSNFNEMMKRYKQLLTYIKSAVTRNHSEKSINSILDYISTSKNVSKFEDHSFGDYLPNCIHKMSFANHFLCTVESY